MDHVAHFATSSHSARERRPRPGLDDKRLTSWNALMVRALAEAGAALGGERGERYLAAAGGAAEFLLTAMRGPDGGHDMSPGPTWTNE